MTHMSKHTHSLKEEGTQMGKAIQYKQSQGSVRSTPANVGAPIQFASGSGPGSENEVPLYPPAG